MAKSIDFINKAKKFITKDVWRLESESLPPIKSFLIKQLKIFLLAIRGFEEDKCRQKASALTFYSLLSVVPVIAMAFGIAKGFGLDQKLEKIIREKFENVTGAVQQSEGDLNIVDKILEFAQSMLQSTKGELIAGIGLLILIWTVMKVLSNIEMSFNDIWQIKKPRPFIRKFTDYISLMLFAPIFFILSSSLTVFISTQIKNIAANIELIGYFSPLIFLGVKLIPYFLMWLLLTMIYMAMPNTKVNIKSAFIAGVIAGTIFQITQWLYIHFQVGVSKYNGIYGSFAALPLFLVWLQTSWWIVLFGAEISFANQNIERYEDEIDVLKISPKQKKIATLMILGLIFNKFKEGEPPLTSSLLSRQLKIPIRMVREAVFDLTEAGIICEVRTDSIKESAFHPAMDISKTSISSVLKCLNSNSKHQLNFTENETTRKLINALNNFEDLAEKSDKNLLIKDI